MMQILADIAGVDASAVTIVSITVYGNARRLLESSIIVNFSIRLPPDATPSQVSNIETSLTTHNIGAAIASSSDETLRLSLPNGVIVYTVQPVDSVEQVEEGISIILVLIVSAVGFVIAIGITVVICCKCRSGAKKTNTQTANTASNASLMLTSNSHRDEDIFRFLPFPSRQAATVAQSTQGYTRRTLDYDMLSL